MGQFYLDAPQSGTWLGSGGERRPGILACTLPDEVTVTLTAAPV
jgi:hypothetical protein